MTSGKANDPTHVVLAICTYRRPDGLQRLLEAVGDLRIPHATRLSIVVIDNDAQGDGAARARLLAPSLPFELHTERHSDEAGLSAARNRAVHRALALSPNRVAFLDDDEWPEPQWLAELLRVQREHDADAVGGPTRSVFPPHATPEQIHNDYYGADLGIADGAACRLQAGGNFLMRASTLVALGPEPFDPAFARSGGEDLAFFTALAQRGARMHWAAQAIVHEDVPPERLAPGWMRQRVINIANSRVRVMQRFERGGHHALVRGIKTCGLGVVAGGLSLAGALSPELARRARLLRWKFIGKLSAHAGRATERREVY